MSLSNPLYVIIGGIKPKRWCTTILL